MDANETQTLRRKRTRHDSGDGALQEPSHVIARQPSQSYVHQCPRHPPYLMREEGVSGHLDSDGLSILRYVDGEYLADGACVGPFERAREPGEVVHPLEGYGRLYHSPHIEPSSQVVGRPSSDRRPRYAAVDRIYIRPCDGAPSRIEGIGDPMGLFHRNVVREVAVKRSDDDFGRVSCIRIEGDHLPCGMDACISAAGSPDSDGLADEASYCCLDFLLYCVGVLLILEPAVPRSVILDDQCVPQCTAYALPNTYSALYSTNSKRAIGDASPLRGPILMMRV